MKLKLKVKILAITAMLAASVCSNAQLKVLDRTNEALPLLIQTDTDMSDTVLIDDNRSRPAVILIDANLQVAGVRRQNSAVYLEPLDPQLSTWFNDVYLPRLRIRFSQNDFCRAAVAAMGSFSLRAKFIQSDCGVNVTAKYDGTRGVDSVVEIGQLTGFRQGVLATGQDNLKVTVVTSQPVCYVDSPTGTPGHTFYANESLAIPTNEFLRVRGLKLTIGSVRATVPLWGVRLDSDTVKLKGAWNVSVSDLDDQNPCGALDSYGSCGTVNFNWTHPGGSAMNGIFAAFRCGDNAAFGAPPGKLCVSGVFDARLAPDQAVPRGRWETRYAAFSVANAFGCAPPVVWPMADSLGLSTSVPIGK